MSLQPRMALFLKAHQLTEADVERGPTGDTRRIRLDGHSMPWTLHFSLWIQKQWREWADELGFKAKDGDRNYDVALRSGYTAYEFDAWLERRVEAVCST